MSLPLWATPQRRAYLVELLISSGGLCIYGHGVDCPNILKHCYTVVEERLVDGWKEDDCDSRSYAWRLEKRRMHSAPRIRRRGQFDSIRREEYLAQRPVYQVSAIGVDAFTHRRVAKVEIRELAITLWVDIGNTALSKNKLRKLSRYNKGAMPEEIINPIRKEVERYI